MKLIFRFTNAIFLEIELNSFALSLGVVINLPLSELLTCQATVLVLPLIVIDTTIQCVL
ncbi:hypothetical protein DPMN_170669 [Dreissena polymorpha]|uniref:Uncharacterized protein n=1 Tax=Dreissena polymorpha TaxID=45954 RepID=A0A9D4IEG7_DREPO|nr:hypothetical protein DPMN_170669 [Dreissena polymorpha]